MSDTRITVMCVDDHAVFRDGIALIINLQPDMRVVATAGRSEDAVRLHRIHRPNVTLMDLRLRGADGVETIAAIRRDCPDACIVVLTMYDGDQDVYRALAAGATAYLLKDTDSNELIKVIRDAHAGRITGQQSPAHPVLTVREQEVLQLIADGMRNRELAERLRVSEETIRTHLRHIYEKMDVNDRTQAITVGIRRGIIRIR